MSDATDGIGTGGRAKRKGEMTDPQTYCPKCGKKKDHEVVVSFGGRSGVLACTQCIDEALKAMKLKALKRKPK